MEVKVFIQAAIFAGILPYFSNGRSCTDKTQAAATPKGLKAIPVVLTIGTLGGEVRLPCHYCSEKVGITGRIWRRRNLHGEETEVNLDMHDDDNRNRVFVDEEHNLIIRRITKEDGAYYFCYDNEDPKGVAKMDILLDVSYRSPLEPILLNMPLDLKEEMRKVLKTCDQIKKIAPVSMYECYAEWSPWGRCDVCGKIGTRKRIGECRLQKFAKAEMETPEGKAMEADFPIVGVSCHSILLDSIPEAKKILSKIPNTVLTEKCQVSCDNYMDQATEMTAYKKGSFLKKIKVKRLQKGLKRGKQTLTSVVKEEKEGAALTLFCPGASLDTRIKWKFQERSLDPKKLKEKTEGRVTIDAIDALHIKNLRVPDGGEYICTLYDVEIGLIRLKVISKYAVFDSTSNFGVLTIVLALNFMLWMILMGVKWKSFTIQRKIQEMTMAKRTIPSQVSKI